MKVPFNWICIKMYFKFLFILQFELILSEADMNHKDSLEDFLQNFIKELTL